MEEFLAYSAKNKRDKILITLCGVIFIIGGIALLQKAGIVIGIIVIVFGAAAVYGGLTAGLSDSAELRKMERDGILLEVLTDFAVAKSYMDDRVRFGERYIFRPKYMRPIAYREIKTVQYGYSMEHGTTDYTVFHVLVGTGSIPTNALYSVPYPHPEEAEEMIGIILMHNPDVKVIK